MPCKCGGRQAALVFARHNWLLRQQPGRLPVNRAPQPLHRRREAHVLDRLPTNAGSQFLKMTWRVLKMALKGATQILGRARDCDRSAHEGLHTGLRWASHFPAHLKDYRFGSCPTRRGSVGLGRRDSAPSAPNSCVPGKLVTASRDLF